MDLKRTGGILLLLFTVLASFGQERVSQTQGEKALVKTARTYARAVEKRDFEKVLALTHEKVLQQFGGMRKMLAEAKRDAEATRRKGFEIEKAELAAPLQGKQVNKTWYRCIPIRITIKGPYGKVYSQAGLLGISEDEGKSWRFVSLAQIEMSTLLSLFPNLPVDLEMPVKQLTTE